MKGEYQPAPYMGHNVPSIPATIVGDLAIFKMPRAPFTVHHVHTRAHVQKAMPTRFFDSGGRVIAKLRELEEWAEAWQAAAPEFFELVRDRAPQGDVSWSGSEHRPLVAKAVAIGQAL